MSIYVYMYKYGLCMYGEKYACICIVYTRTEKSRYVCMSVYVRFMYIRTNVCMYMYIVYLRTEKSKSVYMYTYI